MAAERVAAARRRRPASAPVLLDGRWSRAAPHRPRDRAPSGGASPWSGSAPGAPDWCPPARAERLAGATDLVGYGPYLDLVPAPAAGAAPPRRTTASRPTGPATRSTWPPAGGGSWWCPPATRACSPWRRGAGAARRRRRPNAGAASRSRCSPASPPPRPLAGRGRRAARARLLRHLAVGRPQAVGGRSSAGSTRPPAPTSCIALYNPASRARPVAVRPGARGHAASTVAPTRRSCSGRDVGAARTSRSRVVEPRRARPRAEVDMRTVVIVGSSTTRRFTTAPPGRSAYTPRRYPDPA